MLELIKYVIDLITFGTKNCAEFIFMTNGSRNKKIINRPKIFNLNKNYLNWVIFHLFCNNKKH